jgi:rubrerythrin
MSSEYSEYEKKTLCELINEAIEDESKAKGFYLRVIDASTKEIKDDPKLKAMVEEILKGIADAEEAHHAVLKRMREQFCPI